MEGTAYSFIPFTCSYVFPPLSMWEADRDINFANFQFIPFTHLPTSSYSKAYPCIYKMRELLEFRIFGLETVLRSQKAE